MASDQNYTPELNTVPDTFEFDLEPLNLDPVAPGIAVWADFAPVPTAKRVKLLCSFGGEIIPRPSDGKLRYVGGRTKIIGVGRDTSFAEFVQKMVDVYGRPVVIKYQLPDEDLDTLVSVSCPDDLEYMMEESLDGSAKLRVFLFSSSEHDAQV